MKHDAEKDTKSVSIRANYPFGTIDIETVEVQPLDLVESMPELKSKSSTPTKAIKTSVVSEVAVIGNNKRWFCAYFFFLLIVHFGFDLQKQFWTALMLVILVKCVYIGK